MPAEHSVSDGALKIVKKFEFSGQASLTIYEDKLDGTKNIGYGHQLKENEYEKYKNGITQEEAYNLLKQDLKVAEDRVKRLVKVPLTQNQYDALVSLAYNTKESGYARSKLIHKVNKKDFEGAAKEFDDCNYVNGKKSSGIAKRRAEEKKLFLEN